jgi:hypothetical protein
MNKLGIIAIAGLTISAVSMTIGIVTAAKDGTNVNMSWLDDGLGDCKVNHATATSRSFDWKGGDEVDLSLPVNLHYKPGEGTQVQVSGDPELVSHVKVDDDDIQLDCNHHNWNHQRLDVTLPGNRTFREIDLKGTGSVTLENIDQPELEIGMAGMGDVMASGKTDKFTVSLAGKGDVHAKDLIAQRVEINIAGHGDVETSPIDSADISIAGHGVVKLFTEPKHVDTSILGHGDVEHMAPKG